MFKKRAGVIFLSTLTFYDFQYQEWYMFRFSSLARTSWLVSTTGMTAGGKPIFVCEKRVEPSSLSKSRMSIGKVIFQWFQQYLYCTSVVYVFVNWMNEKNEWLPTVLCFVFKIFVGHRKIHTLNSISFVFKRFWLYLALLEWELKMWHGVTAAASSSVAIAIGCKSSVLFPHQLFLVLCVLTPPESHLAN